MIIILLNYDKIFWAFGEIFNGAFSATAISGGFVGVMVQGIKRAVFSMKLE
ncbi:MAG: alanine:cation symporter family protein [Saprospiraceae bacterium]